MSYSVYVFMYICVYMYVTVHIKSINHLFIKRNDEYAIFEIWKKNLCYVWKNMSSYWHVVE